MLSYLNKLTRIKNSFKTIYFYVIRNKIIFFRITYKNNQASQIYSYYFILFHQNIKKSAINGRENNYNIVSFLGQICFQYASFFSLLYIYIYIHTSSVLITVIYYRACGSMQLINCYFAPFSPDKINFSDNRHRTSSCYLSIGFFFHFQLTIHSIDAQLSMR